MHPVNEEVFSPSDGALDAKWREHVEQCPECAARRAAIERTRAALRALPPLEPVVEWSDIRARFVAVEKKARVQRRRRRALSSLALAASIALVAVLVRLAHLDDNNVVDSSTEKVASTETTGAATIELARLIERSRELDELLQTMPQRPSVELVGMAATLDSMEERIQWLDHQLSYAQAGLDAEQAQRLWQERVELMDSLVKVRYAQAQTASF